MVASSVAWKVEASWKVEGAGSVVLGEPGVCRTKGRMRSTGLFASVSVLLTASSVVTAKSPINLTNWLGTQTSVPAYERIISQPVFQVTTPWGSAYMLFEKYKDEEKEIELEEGLDGDDAAKFSRMQRKEEMQDTRSVSLYFMDEHDARALADEMKQMKNMKDSDLRITCSTLGKALRCSSNLGYGLPTGQPVDGLSGKIPSMDEGGSLRHKIVPSKRELFYAARCAGRERVGCFGDSANEDAQLLLQSQGIIESAKMGLRRNAVKNAMKRTQKARNLAREGMEESTEDRLKREYAHMEGQVGLPVFYAEGLAKRPPKIRRMLQGSKAWSSAAQTPLYFSYEDLMNDWASMRSKSENKSKIPEKPSVEVFNMVDVVAGIDKDQWKTERRAELIREKKGFLGKIPVVHNFVKSKIAPGARSGLGNVVFVPTSMGIEAQERISAAGSHKCRLRPMRSWGKRT